jgi:apolipoprotein N-acyltransferase
MWAPYNVWIIAPIYFGVMFHYARSAKTWRSAFGVAWTMAFLANIFAYGWLAHPFSFIGAPMWQAGLAVGAFSAFLALYVGFAGIAAKRGTFAFAAALALGEWIRGWLFTGFPWNPVAAIWSGIPIVMQSLSLVGTYGLSFLTVYVFAARRDKVYLVVALPVVIFGYFRMGAVEPSGVKVRLVNLASERPLNVDASNFFKQILLSKGDGWEDIDLFVWSESASKFDPTIDPAAATLLAEANNAKSALVLGFNRYEIHEGGYDVYNALGVASRRGMEVVYDKRHLVPFGEYVPLRWLLKFGKFTEGIRDFSAGEGARFIEILGRKVAPLICYEIIFPGLRLPRDVAYILTISNDVWFGANGKAQHFALAKLRAVEEGVPVARVANSGISAVISPYGIASETLAGQGILDVAIPLRLARTLFSYTGNYLVITVLGMALFVLYRKRKK